MENQNSLGKSIIQKKFNSSSFKDGKQNLIKKRPSSTKLDLQKIFQQSIELTRTYKQLAQQNKKLKTQHNKVQSIKANRQNLISMVQKIVQEKSKDLKKNPSNQSSWLVHKLNSKIYDLKNKIDHKEKSITELQLSKESQIIRQKQCQIQCLDQILQWSRQKNLLKQTPYNMNDGCDTDQRKSMILSGIKQIVWMQQEIKQKQDQILEAQRIFEEQDRQSKKIMMEIAKKKAELKQVKQLQDQYIKAQQELKEEKKKKEQRIAGNKTYLDELVQSRHSELKKLEQLKDKYNLIESEQTNTINELQNRLYTLKQEYQEKNKAKQQLTVRVVEEKTSKSNQRWVKRVAFNDVSAIARNLNYQMALRRVSKTQILKQIFRDDEEQFSIKQVIDILEAYPFNMQNSQSRQLLARYCIEDTGQGYFMQDMQTSQAGPIIKSVLSKLIGDVKVFTEEESSIYHDKIKQIMSRFHTLVIQNIDSKEGHRKKVSKEVMEQAIAGIQQDLSFDEISYIILYLYSWSQNIDQLEVSFLKQMQTKDVKWPNISTQNMPVISSRKLVSNKKCEMPPPQINQDSNKQQSKTEKVENYSSQKCDQSPNQQERYEQQLLDE